MSAPEPCGWWEMDPETTEVERCASGKPATFGNCGFSPSIGFCEDHACRCKLLASGQMTEVKPSIGREREQFIELRWKKLHVRLAAARARLTLLEPEGPEGVERANGAMICSTCQLSYYDHAEHPFAPTFMILCDGTVVKV